MNTEPSAHTPPTPPGTRRRRISAALIVVAIINLLIGGWYVGVGVWTAAVFPKLAYMTGEAAGHAGSALKNAQDVLGSSSPNIPDIDQLMQQMRGKFDWPGLAGLGWYTVGMALLIASVALLCGQAWGRTLSCAVCIVGAALQIWGLIAVTLMADPSIDVPVAHAATAVAKYTAAVSSAAFLAYFAVAIAVLWNFRWRLPSMPKLPALPATPPEPMGFPASKRH